MEGRGERGGRGKKGICIYINLQGWPPPVCGCCFYETTRAAFICSCILYMHISVHAHIHVLLASVLPHEDTYTSARAHPRENAHVHAHDAYEHPRMNTHACARIRANTPAHACMRTHMRYAQHAGTCMHAPAQCTCMHMHAHARTHLHMRTHSCKHMPTYFCCALTDWGHTPQL